MTYLFQCGLLATLMVFAISCGAAPEEGTAVDVAAEQAAADPTELDVADVASRLAAGEDIFLLDVRTPEELENDGVIAGYNHIPIEELEARLDEVPRDKPIVAY